VAIQGRLVVPAALSVGRLTLLIFLESDAESLLEKTAIADAPAIAHGRLSANQPPTKTVRPADFVLRLVRARLDSEHGFTGFLKSEEHRYSSSAVRAARCANVESFARVSQLTACGLVTSFRRYRHFLAAPESQITVRDVAVRVGIQRRPDSGSRLASLHLCRRSASTAARVRRPREASRQRGRPGSR